MNKASFWLALGAVLAGLAVAFGAFGAHALSDFLAETGRTATFETAVKYQFYHALGILILALWMKSDSGLKLKLPLQLLALGTGIFSGTLYILVLSQVTWWGAITPIGGTLLIVGWGIVAWQAIKS
jgi:uncharacterized membrane protein YgdD (TMEM256/DUF423 family)